nr:MAG TPA: hypothetical protein [Caudoviricetes sp.]
MPSFQIVSLTYIFTYTIFFYQNLPFTYNL